MHNKNKMTSEDFSKLASSAIDSNLAAAGYCSSLVAKGKNSIAISCGRLSRVKGVEGTLIALTHYEYDEEGDKFIPLRIVTGRIGEEGLLPNTWYTLNEKGEFVEYRQFIENDSIALSKKIKKFFINFIR